MALPKFAKEVVITVGAFGVLSLVWWAGVDEHIMLSDNGLLKVGTVFSTTLGVLSAVVVSFLFVIWQFSRQGRDTAFWCEC